jgi:hypothetical protein
MNKRKTISDRRGSVLLLTIILIIGLSVFLGSFLKIAMGTIKLSDRTFYSNGCVNLAEAGLEEALYALNNADWTGWTSSGGNMSKAIYNISMGRGATGTVKVRINNYATSLTPTVVAEGRANLSTGPDVIKQVEIEASTKSFWANGIVAKDTVTFSGGPGYVDSYDSTDPAHSTGGLYDFAKRKDNGSVGSVLVTTDALALGNTEIWGYAATGGSAPNVGPGGQIHGVNTPAGVNVDPARIRTDFTAEFDPIPSPGSFDQIYTNVNGPAVFGTAGSATVIRATSISNNASEVTQIQGDVTLVVTDDIDIGGTFEVAANSSLTLYVEGDVNVKGNGIVNVTGLPKNLIVYGTASSDQEIKLAGNAAVQAAIFAPNADLVMKGGGVHGTFMGSAVADAVTLTGNFRFHYDESLANLATSGVYTVGGWRELIGQAQWVSF